MRRLKTQNINEIYHIKEYMPKYRKKPIVIHAEQWFRGKEIEGLMIFRHEDEDGHFFVFQNHILKH